MNKRRPRLYHMLVELDTHENAALLIMRFPDAFGAQLTGHDGFLRQISCKVNLPDFEQQEFWQLLLLVMSGFVEVHGIEIKDYLASPDMEFDEWAEDMEKRANDPRYIVFERPGSKVWHYGVNADDLPAMRREIREKVLGPKGMEILRSRLQSERKGRAPH